MKKGFTLAEVLITLVIIGVIAALTLPNLITKHEKEQTVIKLRKAYNILQNATKLSVIENGSTSEWDLSLNEKDFAEKYYAPYLKLSTKSKEEWVTYKTVKADKQHITKYFYLVLADGMLLTIRKWNESIMLIIDINGEKGPNKTGRDLFSFTICLKTKPDRVITYTQYCDRSLEYRAMASGVGTSGQCNAQATGGIIGPGSYCSRLIELDGWEIKDDYPW